MSFLKIQSKKDWFIIESYVRNTQFKPTIIYIIYVCKAIEVHGVGKKSDEFVFKMIRAHKFKKIIS